MSDITLRIRQVFHDLGLSQTAFARKIGVTPAYIWKILHHDDVRPSDRTVSDICEKFKVSEVWLRTGKGETYIQTDDDVEFIKICEHINQTDAFIKRVIKAYWKLDEEEKAAVRKLIDSY